MSLEKDVGAGDIQTISNVKKTAFPDKSKRSEQKFYKLLNPHRKRKPYFCCSINCNEAAPLPAPAPADDLSCL